ncbi:MAG: cytochrome ubiquinol oxidase subunit I [Phycisphaerales bacterium]
MDDLLFARLQMAVSLGFHIVFAAIGMAMPVLMVLAEWRHNRTGDDEFLALARRWAKGTAVFFAIGAVSGTVLSFELGLLWPTFMEHAGGIIGMPFGLEGFAFFTEAIFLGVYLYAWDKVSKGAHLLAGIVVAVSGNVSAAFIIMVNGWMNSPAGFEYDAATNTFSNIDPVAAMLNDAWPLQAIHMILAAFMATGFAVAGIHAIGLLRDRASTFHRKALGIAMSLAIPAAVLQPVTGHFAAQRLHDAQPAKLAAMEAHFETAAPAPLTIGGVVDEDAREVRYAIEIPRLLSFLVHDNFSGEVAGLNDIPEDEWPPVAIVHYAFDGMVGLGMLMLGVGAWFAVAYFRRKTVPTNTLLLRALVVLLPAGFIAIELGWIVTEVGRQPWIIHGVMRTKDAVTPMPGLVAPFITFSVVYLVLGAIVACLFAQQVRGTYSPRAPHASTPVDNPDDPHAAVRIDAQEPR